MSDWQKDVLDFHTKFKCIVGDKPQFSDEKTMKLRLALINEEIDELTEAYKDKDLSSFIDAIADSIYVLLGTAISVGVDLKPIWDEVQKTNMAKVPGNSRKDGKVLKPENWTPPDIDTLLKEQGWED